METLQVIKRVKNYLKIVTASDLCKKLGISQQTLAGRIKRNTIPTYEILSVLENTDADLRHIFYGEDSKASKKQSNIQFYNDVLNTKSDGTINCDSNFEMIYIDEHIMEEALSSSIVAFKIHSDSMGRTIKTGDIIFADRSKTHIEDGRIYLIQTNGSVIIRRIFESPFGLILKSDNPNHPQYDVKESDITILAKVIKKLEVL